MRPAAQFVANLTVLIALFGTAGAGVAQTTPPAQAPAASQPTAKVEASVLVTESSQSGYSEFGPARILLSCRHSIRKIWMQQTGKEAKDYPYGGKACLSEGQDEKTEVLKACRLFQKYGREPVSQSECLWLTRQDTAGGPAWPTPDSNTGKCATDPWQCTFSKGAPANFPNEGKKWSYSSTVVTTTTTTTAAPTPSPTPAQPAVPTATPQSGGRAIVALKMTPVQPGSTGMQEGARIKITAKGGRVSIATISGPLVTVADKNVGISTKEFTKSPFSFCTLHRANKQMSTGVFAPATELNTADATHVTREPIYECKLAVAGADGKVPLVLEDGQTEEFVLYFNQKAGYTGNFPVYTIDFNQSMLGGGVPITFEQLATE